MAKEIRYKNNESLAGSKKSVKKISARAENIFRIVLKTMSWIVGLSFVAIIILASINIPALDTLVKIIFYVGISNLILFALLEMFGSAIKEFLNKLVQL